VNVPDTTKITGFEAQVQASFGDWTGEAGAGVMRSKLGRFFATDPRATSFLPCDPETGPVSASSNALEGRDQTYAPDLTFNVALQREFRVGNDTITPRLNYGYVSEQWATLFQNEARGDRVESRSILNAQVEWRRGDYVWTLYGSNLTDQHYVAAINTGLRFAGPPRQFGVRVVKLF
jgi:iron complex outermembrane receptor protein